MTAEKGIAANASHGVVVYVTIGSEEDAKEMSRHLLAERLIACANLLPMQSLYRWEGKAEEGPEIGMFLKTAPDRLAALMARIPELHPYDVPCIEVLPLAGAHAPYLEWVQKETRPV